MHKWTYVHNGRCHSMWDETGNFWTENQNRVRYAGTSVCDFDCSQEANALALALYNCGNGAMHCCLQSSFFCLNTQKHICCIEQHQRTPIWIQTRQSPCTSMYRSMIVRVWNDWHCHLNASTPWHRRDCGRHPVTAYHSIKCYSPIQQSLASSIESWCLL